MLGNYTELYGDIFKLREKMLNDFQLKQRLNKITTRKSPYMSESSNEVDRSLSNKVDLHTSITKKEVKLPTIKTNKSEGRKSPSRENKSLMDVMLESKKVGNKIKEGKLQLENEKFLVKLLSVKSPLRVDVMNESFRKSRDYMNLACKVKDHADMRKKVMRSFRLSEGVGKVQEDFRKMLNI